MKTIKIKQYGLLRPTIAYFENKIIISKGLDIETLTQFWREEFGLFDKEIILTFPSKEARCLKQRLISSTKTLEEIFYEYGFLCAEVGE